MIIAVTGGTGFVGGHVLRLAFEHGHTVRALTRRPQPPQPSVTWIAGTLADPGSLCDGADAVLHIAGVVNAADRAGFDAGNVAGTASILAAVVAAGVRRFVHVSSLAAREPGLSMYGASKAAAEALVAASGLDWAIVRPPGVYGAGDTEMLAVFQLAARGVAIAPGPGRFSLIEVGDLAQALLAVTAATVTGTYEIDDGHGGYGHGELARAVGAALGRRPVVIPLPPRLLRLGAMLDTAFSRRRGRLPRLSHDRARYLAHPDWVVDPARALPEAVWRPSVVLASGLAATAAWYRAQGWLPLR